MVISRKQYERFRLVIRGEVVWVTVVESRGKVRLGVTADMAVQILREELLPRGEQYGQQQTERSASDGEGEASNEEADPAGGPGRGEGEDRAGEEFGAGVDRAGR